MKNYSCILLFMFSGIFSLWGQEYWQQEVNYQINVKLDDVHHRLDAWIEMEYINHSPDELKDIYIHLWPNAYRNSETALGRQNYSSDYEMFPNGPDKDAGWIDSLDFRTSAGPISWEYDANHQDIAILHLSEALKPGQKLVFNTPFQVKIPSGEISRLGHIGQSYQITQWYPKPAVYDRDGWHQMPYLNQGEFYSEYASYDVSITLPKNYVVGATGDLQTSSERNFMDSLAEATLERYDREGRITKKGRGGRDSAFPASSKSWKTIRFTQKKVHDFAWFADKRNQVLKGELELPHSGRKVTTWSLFTWGNSELWRRAPEYIRDGAYYYSLWNGDYPYDQITAVDGTISAGGGMEYPNVTVIGNSGKAIDLEVVIVHEVGHNWFYGILGSNERVHGWMDEGLNTLNEMRYMSTKYPDNKYLSDMVLNGSFHLNDLDHHDSGDISYRLLAGIGEDQPIETHSAAFNSINYGIVMYQKTGLVFHYLKEMLGDSLFDQGMRKYYDTWKFKHPQPKDLKRVLEQESGKDLSWLFEELIPTTKHLDFKLKSVRNTKDGTRIRVKNKGQLEVPLKLTVFAGEEKEVLLTNPFKGKLELHSKLQGVDRVIIDENKQIPELNRRNNQWNRGWLFKRCEPLKLEFLIGDMERDRNNHFWLPLMAANAHDGFMLGLGAHNMGISMNHFQYLLAPMYAFKGKRASGIAEFSYRFLPAKGIKLSRVGVSVKSFSQGLTSQAQDRSEAYYLGISPYLYLKLGNRGPVKDYEQNVLFQGLFRQDYLDGFTNRSGAFARYRLKLSKKRFRWELMARTDYLADVDSGEDMLRYQLSSTYEFKYLNREKERWIELRTYAGTFAFNHFASGTISNQMTQLALAGTNGIQDVYLEDYYFDRQYTRNWSGQRGENMGGFKSTSDYGQGADWLMTANVFAQLPFGPRSLGIFADVGGLKQGTVVYGVFNTGIGLRFGDFFGLYFPIYNSDHLEAAYTGKNYLNRIRFSLRLNPVNRPLPLQQIF
ncbi:MAG: M1 family peptidase [Bacteroidetes bacterium]|nr:MAG: M1 family peptidase [Bacteroidota bacterium]